MPPGPKPLPIIGNLNVVDLKKPHKSLMELHEKYGEIFTMHFGPKKTVVIAGYRAVKDALVSQADDFGERADTPLFKLISEGKGIVFSNGELWKAIRRFTLSTLRDFGMGKKTIEARIQDELIPLIENFKSHNEKPFDTDIIMNCAVSNVICSIIFGERFEYKDTRFKKLIRLMGVNEKLAGSPKMVLFNFFPRISSFLGAHKQLMQNFDEVKEFVLKRIKHQRQMLDTNAISGYIDAYLLKQEQESTKAETHFDDENLVYSVLDLFGAGTGTTSTTLRWGILLMMKYPEIQKKIQEEIRTQIKQGQMPRADDRRNMPYTEAVIHEVQRFANIIPLNLSHTTPNDVYFRGYCIPKNAPFWHQHLCCCFFFSNFELCCKRTELNSGTGTTCIKKNGTEVIPFLTSVLHDKTQWETPYEFNPNHFLDAKGKFLKRDAFMPFSAGRRACVGESLAKMELFLFFTGLLQIFTFYPPPGVSREDISLEPGTGFLLFPLPHLVCAKLNY
ncbi:cytochrome P450 2K1-like isoform X2 [Aquarana catesbeiana]|uniref:cytochrome P450 2K1-like isoform X2 n=1 Tax=Aquarana catesbeiana TaxID=8400 RepID=UPI003CCA4015